MLIRIFVIADINNHRVRRPNQKELRAMFLFLKGKYLNEKLPAVPGKECHAIQVSEKTLDDRVRMLSSSSVLRRCSTCCWVRCTLSYGLPFILVVDIRVFFLITSLQLGVFSVQCQAVVLSHPSDHPHLRLFNLRLQLCLRGPRQQC